MRLFGARRAAGGSTYWLLVLLICPVRAPASEADDFFCRTPLLQLMCDDSDGLRARIESGAGFESQGSYDCISVATDGSVLVHRYLAVLRCVRMVQILAPPGHEAPAWTGSWERSGRLDVLWANAAEAGVAAGDGGKRVYVAASSNELLVFDRAPNTGLLSLQDVRGFRSEAARAEFLADIRARWSRELSKRIER
jgi:hypothetical protein